MRRFFCAAAVLALAATCPVPGWAGDREIAEQIINRLKVQRDAGTLKGFKLDLKVEEGVVLLKGKVSNTSQKSTVLAAAEDLEGISEVVDQITVEATQAAPAPAQSEASASEPGGFSFRQALQQEATQMQPAEEGQFEGVYTAAEAAPASVAPASANEVGAADDAVTDAVIGALGRAQQEGHLRGFGVDVTTTGGKVLLKGRTSTPAHKQLILDLARNTQGVTSVIDDITVYSPERLQATGAQPIQDPRPVAQGVQPVAHPAPAPAPAPAPGIGHAGVVHGGAAVHGGAVMHGGVAGQPVPMAPYAAGAAAPRYDQPYLPNYAWPGYAAYPNYAALSYPQQYSPSAWPYIGPFYPYPQVPLGWRKVSLEWDDGWWFLDFTDRNGRH